MGNNAGAGLGFYCQLRTRPARGRPSSCGHATRFQYMTSDISLSCRDIERYLGEDESRVHALRGVSLDIAHGTVHAVVGPSGCGKSTLLYILGLLDHPDHGSVMLNSAPASHLSDEELSQRRNEFIGFI